MWLRCKLLPCLFTEHIFFSFFRTSSVAQVGGRSGLTVFSFEADATAVALLAAVLAIPFNQKSHKAPRDSVELAIESIESPSRWVDKVLRSVVDAKNDNKDLSFEDLVETMDRAWGSMV